MGIKAIDGKRKKEGTLGRLKAWFKTGRENWGCIRQLGDCVVGIFRALVSA